jgi:putative hemolysin
MLATALLSEMWQQRTPIALIVDETGGVTGLVTMEDIAEEVIGEVISEHKPADTDSDQVRQGRHGRRGGVDADL